MSKKLVTRDEAVETVMKHEWKTYVPRVFQIEEGHSTSEMDDVVSSLAEGNDAGYANFWIAAAYYLIWLESLGLGYEALQVSWMAMTDMNNLSSDPYWGLDWKTIMLMMDKASYTAKEMSRFAK